MAARLRFPPARGRRGKPVALVRPGPAGLAEGRPRPTPTLSGFPRAVRRLPLLTRRLAFFLSPHFTPAPLAEARAAGSLVVVTELGLKDRAGGLRRADLWLEWRSPEGAPCFLILEAKLDAPDRPGQLLRAYADHLRRHIARARTARGWCVQPLRLEVGAEKVCGYPLSVSGIEAVNAYAGGKTIVITAGMMNFVESDAELALVLSHEMAHNTMARWWLKRPGCRVSSSATPTLASDHRIAVNSRPRCGSAPCGHHPYRARASVPALIAFAV
ncbi:MAG: M48 family metalloprotease [Magnetospirillum sp.]|nr:M48 family metalloprotease [Magnetospirillum sp.]